MMLEEPFIPQLLKLHSRQPWLPFRVCKEGVWTENHVLALEYCLFPFPGRGGWQNEWTDLDFTLLQPGSCKDPPSSAHAIEEPDIATLLSGSKGAPRHLCLSLGYQSNGTMTPKNQNFPRNLMPRKGKAGVW